jgi:hypothetical protein
MSDITFYALSELGATNYTVTSNDEVIFSDPSTAPSQEDIDAKIAELTAALPLTKLRNKRNSLLVETDWWAMSDLTMTAGQTSYRQELRDITSNYTSLEDVVWPTKP